MRFTSVLCKLRPTFIGQQLELRGSFLPARYKLTTQTNNGNHQLQWSQWRGVQTNNGNKKQDDGIEYTITFKKGLLVKDVIKQVYSLYGPVFVACHILVSLASLGFFCSLVLLSVDLTSYMPMGMVEYVGQKMMNATDTGGASIFLTRTVSRMIKYRTTKK